MQFDIELISKMARIIDDYETVLQAFYITNQHDRSTMSNCVMLNYIEHFAEQNEGLNARINRIKDGEPIPLISKSNT